MHTVKIVIFVAFVLEPPEKNERRFRAGLECARRNFSGGSKTKKYACLTFQRKKNKMCVILTGDASGCSQKHDLETGALWLQPEAQWRVRTAPLLQAQEQLSLPFGAQELPV